jgi:hypothetical protein
VPFKTVEVAGLDEALTAYVREDTRSGFRCLAIRPRVPEMYYSSQAGYIVLSEGAVQALVDLIKRVPLTRSVVGFDYVNKQSDS